MSKKYNPSIVGIDNDLAFSKKTAWLYVSLPAMPYEFLDYQARESLAQRINLGLESLIQRADKSIECHLLVTSVPFDDYEWATSLSKRTATTKPSPYWPTFFNKMVKHVHSQGFRKREVFLGINLGNRSEYRSTSAFGGLRDVSNVISNVMGVKDYLIAEKEIEFWEKRAQEYKRSLLYGQLQAKEIDANTIARLIKETLWPAMSVPEVSACEKTRWGEGEITGIGVAGIENNKKFLKIEQTDSRGREQVGYRATLCFSRFPDELDFPRQEPWIHFASMLSSPATISSRFTIEPATKVIKQVGQKLKEAEDQAANAGGKVSYAVQEQIQAAHELNYSLTRDRKPWIYGRHRIAITARTEEQLRNRVTEAIDHYKSLDIDVVWPTGDQLNLMLEGQPGDRVRVPAYYQRQELGIIPIGMPTGSGGVGDSVKRSETGAVKGWIGPYIGRTTSRVEEPVFLSLHSAIARNKPPGLVITGAPGGGKSFAAFTITYLMALQGVWTIFIDPKGDALPLADLPGLEGRVKKFDLKYGHAGLLDPFTLSPDKSEQSLLAVETISLFLGGRLTSETESALYEAISEVSKRANPSLYEVVEVLLRKTTEPASLSLGRKLELIRDLPFARLCFSPNTGERVPFRADDGLTIISLASLDLPATSERENYSTSNHLAVGLMYLLVHYTESLMYSADKSHPKAVVIDEAWSITTTPQGANMIPRLTRLGRALNTAVVLVSQNAGDFIKLTNNMSYRMAFGTTDKDEIQNISEFFGLEKGEDGLVTQGNASTIANLGNGACLMKDADGKIARIQVDAWDYSMLKAFDTNPETRGKEGT